MNADIKKDIESQINYAVGKYGGNRPPSLARAEAESIVNKAMKSYDPKNGGVKTFLSSRLQKMSRTAYKASSPLRIPETRLMGRRKLRDFIDGYKDTHGFSPSDEDIAEGMGVSIKEAARMTQEYGAVRAESLYAGGKEKAAGLSNLGIIHSLPIESRAIAEDIFIREETDKKMMKRTGMKRSSYLNMKRDLASKIKVLSHSQNIERI